MQRNLSLSGQAAAKEMPLEEVTHHKELMRRIERESQFKFREAGLMTLHNHLAYVREKKKAKELFIFDIGATSSLEVDKDAPSLEQMLAMDMQASFKEGTRSETDGAMLDAASVSDVGFDNRLGLFLCKPLDLSKVLSTR